MTITFQSMTLYSILCHCSEAYYDYEFIYICYYIFMQTLDKKKYASVFDVLCNINYVILAS